MTTYSIPVSPYNYGNIKLTTGGSGSSGTYYTTTQANPTWSIANGTSSAMAGEVRIVGDAVFEGNITLEGRDLGERLDRIEARLHILKPNTKLEQGWEELAELRRQYVELEEKLLEKQRVFDILNKPLD